MRIVFNYYLEENVSVYTINDATDLQVRERRVTAAACKLKKYIIIIITAIIITIVISPKLRIKLGNQAEPSTLDSIRQPNLCFELVICSFFDPAFQFNVNKPARQGKNRQVQTQPL